MTTSALAPSAHQIASDNWLRYEYGKDKGHIDYLPHAARCEDMYLGGGRQYTAEAKARLSAEGRPPYEFNGIMSSVNTALGYQIHNRMDIAFKPRGGDADLDRATILSKVSMQVADQSNLRWHETQVFSDGLIQQRGYFDVRMDFDSNIKGEILVGTLDPLDVIPDSDAKSYDPDKWSDVIITRWLTLDEIEQLWGKAARKLAEDSKDVGPDFGEMDDEVPRNKFGTRANLHHDSCGTKEDGLERYRIIDRQRFVYESTGCIVWPDTGDVKPEDLMAPDSIADALANGAVRARRMRKRIKWTVTTRSAVLHDTFSPYEHFTVVPYFAYFRRGKTVGMVDNAIDPQDALNKAISQYLHIISTTSNSGWMVEQNSLANMKTKDLETNGARSGLVIEYKAGSTKPEKITPNQVPTGVAQIIDRADKALKDVTVPEAMRGVHTGEASGIAIQSDQFASQQQLAVPLDNLAYTRQLLAKRILKLVQTYYDTHRIFRITETDPNTGKPATQVLEINRFDPGTGTYINDVTIGTYDVVISEQPMQVTFQNSQFKQAMEMRQAGVAIPDPAILRYSNLSDKEDLLAGMQANQPPADPTLEARVQLIQAQARKTDAQATDVKVKTQYSGVQTAQVVAAVPATAMLADGLLKSAGYVDQDAGPIVPQVPPGLPTTDMPQSTDPMNPANPASPAVGASEGIETLAADGVDA